MSVRSQLRGLAALVALLTAPIALADDAKLERLEFRRIEMAVDFRIVLYAGDKAQAEAAATAAFDRVRSLNAVMSDYDPDSELRRLCAASGPGKPVAVGDDLWRMLTLSRQIAEKSDGAFDPTCSPIVRLWRRARRQHELPSAERLAEARAATGYQKMRLRAEDHTVELLAPNMRLDLGGVAKGYATAEALAVLAERGFARAMVEAGGDLALGLPPPGANGWRVGLATAGPAGPARFYLTASQTSVATSGDMWQYVVIDGTRYSHIVDPRTGIGVTDRSQVTVVYRDGATADALSTALSVLGPKKGLELIDSIPEPAALVVRPNGDDTEVFTSSRWAELGVEKANAPAKEP